MGLMGFMRPMRIMGVFLISVVLSLLETTIVSLPLLFLWVLVFSMASGEKESFWLAFWSGLWLDFLKGSGWGETSLIFLIFCLVVSLYKRKFKVEHPLYFLPFVGVASGVWEFWVFGEVRVVGVVWGLAVAVGMLKLARRLNLDIRF